MAAFVLTLPASVLAAESAKVSYTKNCAGCHGTTGNGDGPAASNLNPKPKPFSQVLKGKSDAWIGKVVKDGGPAVGESAIMPSHPGMTDAQVRATVGYIKSL